MLIHFYFCYANSFLIPKLLAPSKFTGRASAASFSGAGSAGRRPASFCRGASTAGSAGGRRRRALQGGVDGGLCRGASTAGSAGRRPVSFSGRGVGRPAERRVSGGGGRGRGRERSWRREKSAHRGRRRASPGRGRAACRRGFVWRTNVLSGFGDLVGSGGGRRLLVIYLGVIGPGSSHQPGPMDQRSRLMPWTGTNDLGEGALLSRLVPRINGPDWCHELGPMTWVGGAAEPPRAQDQWSRLMPLTGTNDPFLRFYQENTFCFPF
jgi:hypothetical protein